MPSAHRGYANMGKCACLLNSSVYTCKDPQDSVNENQMYPGQMENMRRLIFVFSITFSCNVDHKF